MNFLKNSSITDPLMSVRFSKNKLFQNCFKISKANISRINIIQAFILTSLERKYSSLQKRFTAVHLHLLQPTFERLVLCRCQKGNPMLTWAFLSKVLSKLDAYTEFSRKNEHSSRHLSLGQHKLCCVMSLIVWISYNLQLR